MLSENVRERTETPTRRKSLSADLHYLEQTSCNKQLFEIQSDILSGKFYEDGASVGDSEHWFRRFIDHTDVKVTALTMPN